MKCLLKQRMASGKEAKSTLRYTVHRRAKSTHNRTVTLHRPGEEDRDGNKIFNDR